MSSEAWVAIAVVAGGAWWWWISQKPDAARPSPADKALDQLSTNRYAVWALIAAGIAVGVIIVGQIIYSISSPGHCEGGVSYDRAYGPDCDDWRSGTNGWWFLK